MPAPLRSPFLNSRRFRTCDRRDGSSFSSAAKKWFFKKDKKDSRHDQRRQDLDNKQYPISTLSNAEFFPDLRNNAEAEQMG